MERRVFVGLDLGQRQDHSAIGVVCGAEEPEGGFDYQRWVQPMRTVWRDLVDKLFEGVKQIV